MDTEILDSGEVEKMIKIGDGSGNALEVARHRKAIDIPYIRIGKRRVRYRRSDVLAWLDKHTVNPETPKPKRPRRKQRSA